MDTIKPKAPRYGGRRDDLQNEGRQTFNLSLEELFDLLARTRERCLSFQRKTDKKCFNLLGRYIRKPEI